MGKAQPPEGAPKQALYRILYSSNVPKSQSADDIETNIETILRFSREHNPASGITGVLVTNKRMYAQILEGPAPAVKDLIGHIACDRRHQGLRVISSHASDHRIFDDWSMAFVRTNRDLEAEAYIFPTGHEQSNIMAISAFCMSVRRHLLNGTGF